MNRLLGGSRSSARLLRRPFATSPRSLAEPTNTIISPTAHAAVPVKARRPVGGLRGGIIGFLLGLSAAGSYGYLYIFEEYQSASNLLLVSVEELKASTLKMTNHVRRIEAVERDLASQKERGASHDEVSSVRQEMKKLVDALRIEHLDLKAHVWGIEQEIKSDSSSSTVRLA